MYKIYKGFILLSFLFLFALMPACNVYASDDPEYDNAYAVYQNQGGGKALPLMKQCAEKGNPTAMWMLAWIYVHNLDDANTNYIEGAAWFKRCLENPSLSLSTEQYSMYELGTIYWSGGHGLEKDIPYARYLFEGLVEAGWNGDGTRDPNGQLLKLVAEYILKDTKNDADYEKAGKAFKKNRPKEALPLLKQSAEYKNIDAMELLGMMYKCGVGTKKDYMEAATWYRKAAELGSSYSMLNMAKFYDNGQGVTQDEIMAKDWYKKSVLAGNKEARALMGEKMKRKPLEEPAAIEIVNKLRYAKNGAPWGAVINKFILKPKWEYSYDDKNGHVVKLRGYYEDAQKEKCSITIVYVLNCTPNVETESMDYSIKEIYSSVKNDKMVKSIPDWLAYELE